MSIDAAGTTMQRSDRTLMCPARFCCLKQDGQDAQDEQDDSTSPRGCLAPPKTIGARVAIAIKVRWTFSPYCAYVL